jgi:hypothetical protein
MSFLKKNTTMQDFQTHRYGYNIGNFQQSQATATLFGIDPNSESDLLLEYVAKTRTNDLKQLLIQKGYDVSEDTRFIMFAKEYMATEEGLTQIINLLPYKDLFSTPNQGANTSVVTPNTATSMGNSTTPTSLMGQGSFDTLLQAHFANMSKPNATPATEHGWFVKVNILTVALSLATVYLVVKLYEHFKNA